jgi:NarL family two-component system response regulator LiaR
MSEKIRVMIVDDHQIVRDGLRMFLSVEQDMELVGEASNGGDALTLCAQTEPHVVLMDLVMPRMDGSEATTRIREAHPGVQVIALTSYAEQDLVQQALEAGAIAYVLKDIESEKLAEAIREANKGKVTLDPAAARALIESASQQPKPGGDLTRREWDVLELLVEGYTNKQIAEALTISIGTVRFHVSNILSKLGASNRTEAAHIAQENGLV